MCLWYVIGEKYGEKKSFFTSLVTEERSHPELDPDPLVRGADPRIRNSVFCNIQNWNSSSIFCRIFKLYLHLFKIRVLKRKKKIFR
jgi:hypothetical protein